MEAAQLKNARGWHGEKWGNIMSRKLEFFVKVLRLAVIVYYMVDFFI